MRTGHSLFLPKPAEVALDTLAWAQRHTGLSRPPEREPGHATGSWPKFREQILHDDRLRELIVGTIEDPEAIDPEIFDVPRLRAMLSEHLEGRADRRKILFLLATFGSWHRRYGPPGRALSA